MPRSGTRPRLRLLHTSDVHLGAYDYRGADEGSRAALEAGFRRVIDIGIAEGVDLALIAGDFFDNARVREETLAFAAEQLARLDRPVVIAPGNHDHVGPHSVYDRRDLSATAQNVTVMRQQDGETVAVDGLEVEVWARSHTETLPDFRPFEGVPPRGDAAWQLGVGHGHFIHPNALLHHSFHILEEHLVEAQRDYVALGHWEQMTRVAAGELGEAAYSGAPIGLGGESGGHVLIVDLQEDGAVTLRAVPLAEGAPHLAHDDLPYLRGLR
ncbi:MAG: DNA repair exonuclease [Dehalococcoidia bacterium]|nr:DNA repair exonuclease [Dehalococcoidia bacterium]